MIEYFLTPQSIEALGWTLLHSLWQGAAFAILLVLILIALRSYSAQSRYIVSVGLLCAFFLTLSSTFWLQWQEANTRFEMTASPLNQQPADDVFVMNQITENVLQSDNKGEYALPPNGKTLESNQSSWLVEFKNYYDQHLPLLVTIWFLGVLFLQLRLLGQLAYVQRLKHYGTQLFPATWSDKIEELEGKLRIQKKVRYLTSIRIESPMVIGWLKPVVLLPRPLFTSLTETEIYAVLAHELAHIRREDFIVNLLQTFLCNVFFFHPGVWWISNRIDDEREHCCDDLAVAATGPATSYAKTLINVSEFQLKMQNNTPLAMALSGKSKRTGGGGFSSRIRRLFMGSNNVGSFREGFATAIILFTALFLGVVATGSTIQATHSQIPSDVSNTESTPDREVPNSLDLNLNNNITTITNTTTTEDNPTSNLSSVVDQSELPIAAPMIPVAPVIAVRSDNKQVETRVDALIMACGEGDIEFVKILLNSGIDVNGIGSERFTPLMMATKNEETEVVEYLLNHGANVNQTYNGWTALIQAANEGSLEIMKLLLKAGAEVNYYWNQGSPTAISAAASEGHLKCLQLLVDHGADINGLGKSLPPLHIAAAENEGDIIDYLIAQKVNLNKQDAAGRTALMYAAAEGKKYSVKKLIEAGADILIVDFDGANARDYAKEEGEYEVKDYIEKESDTDYEENEKGYHYDSPDYSEVYKRPGIRQSTLDGLIEKVERIVDQGGTGVNITDDYGRTPLHIASAEGHTNDMQILIDLGADVNAQDKQGRTPLMYAAAEDEGDAVALLVSRLADVNIQDVNGMRAYEWVLSGRNSDLARFLSLITESKTRAVKNKRSGSTQHKNIQKEQEKRIKKEVKKRETFHVAADGTHLRQYDLEKKIPALLEAVRNGSIEDVRELLHNELNLNAADATGQTALMAAASGNRLDIAKLLIQNLADVNRSSLSGLTALHYAALENHDQMAQLLLKNGAKVDATMHYSSTDGNYGKEPLVWEYIGATPLLIAVESGNTEVLSVLINAGANTNHLLTRNEYRLNKDRETYLSASEVMGLDDDFLKEVEFQTSDDAWTPYKQALLLNEPSILAYFQK